jgi:4'-phosphopantetheinyl transferase
MLHWVFLPAGQAEPPWPVAAWLSKPERAQLGALRVEKRRGDWLRGRHAVKQAGVRAIRETYGVCLPLASLEVERERSGAPGLRLAPGAAGFAGFEGGARLPIAVSLSHSCGAAFAVAAPARAGDGVGADLERVEPRAPALVADFFAPEEAAACERRPALRDLFVTAVWSAKEAVLKTLRLGLSVDTRRVVCVPRAPSCQDAPLVPFTGGWRRVDVLRAPGLAGPIAACWREHAGFVQVLAWCADGPTRAVAP